MLTSVSPTYIPGESAYSWVSQCFVHSAYSDRNRFCERLFHRPAIRLHPVLPGHIEVTAQAAGVASVMLNAGDIEAAAAPPMPELPLHRAWVAAGVGWSIKTEVDRFTDPGLATVLPIHRVA